MKHLLWVPYTLTILIVVVIIFFRTLTVSVSVFLDWLLDKPLADFCQYCKKELGV
jgi:hypothetical protein